MAFWEVKGKLTALAVMLLLAGSARALAAARPTILPDACGADDVRFEVKTEKHKPPPAAPSDGKALLVLSESFPAHGPFVPHPTVRFGVDGAWVGANESNSYFAVEIAPGEHHVCASWQSISGQLRSEAGLGKFTAEAGKTYYFEAAFQVLLVSGGPGTQTNGGSMNMDFGPLDEDTGRYRVKAWPLSVSKPK